jgi:hypothetical protein
MEFSLIITPPEMEKEPLPELVGEGPEPELIQ